MTYLLIYFAIISLVAFAVTVFDKVRAMRGGRRVKEATLLFISALGGSGVMLLTMLLICHKIRKKKFMVGIPLIILAQLAIAVVIWRVFYACTA